MDVPRKSETPAHGVRIWSCRRLGGLRQLLFLDMLAPKDLGSSQPRRGLLSRRPSFRIRPTPLRRNHSDQIRERLASFNNFDFSRDGSSTSSQIFSELRMCAFQALDPQQRSSARNRPRRAPCAQGQRIWSATVRVTIEVQPSRVALTGQPPAVAFRQLKHAGCTRGAVWTAGWTWHLPIRWVTRCRASQRAYGRSSADVAFYVGGAYPRPRVVTGPDINGLYSCEHNNDSNEITKLRITLKCHNLLP
jgi:hypothetical protein